jgi:hypothetical protein
MTGTPCRQSYEIGGLLIGISKHHTLENKKIIKNYKKIPLEYDLRGIYD